MDNVERVAGEDHSALQNIGGRKKKKTYSMTTLSRPIVWAEITVTPMVVINISKNGVPSKREHTRCVIYSNIIEVPGFFCG